MSIDQTTIILIASIVTIVTGIAISKALSTSKHLKQKERDMLRIKYALIGAHMHQLDWEVIESAIHYLENNTNASFIDAINYGHNEWVK